MHGSLYMAHTSRQPLPLHLKHQVGWEGGQTGARSRGALPAQCSAVVVWDAPICCKPVQASHKGDLGQYRLLPIVL